MNESAFWHPSGVRAVPVPVSAAMLVSLLYVAVRRILELLVLRTRSERSLEPHLHHTKDGAAVSRPILRPTLARALRARRTLWGHP